MEFVLNSPPEYRRVKYTVSQTVSRLGDYTIQNLIVYSGGWYVYAILIATVFNLASGYVLQKMWAFQNKAPKPQKTWKELVTFLIIRGGYGLLGFGIVFLLYKVFEQEYWVSSLTAMIVLWVASYGASRDLFEGSLQDLPLPIRYIRILLVRQLPQAFKNSYAWLQRTCDKIF